MLARTLPGRRAFLLGAVLAALAAVVTTGARAGAAAADADAPSGPLLVVVAHPDDEALGFSGVVARARAAGRRVYVAFVTNGEDGGNLSNASSYCGIGPGSASGSAYLGLRRDGEAQASTALLGVARGSVFFLGYPDGRLAAMATSATPLTTDVTGLHRTWARAGDGSTGDSCDGDLRFLLDGTHAQFTGDELAGDLDRLLALTRPTDVYTHAGFEGHADHREVYRQVAAALGRSGLIVRLHTTMIHPAETDACSKLSIEQWPNPTSAEAGADPAQRSTPLADFTPPPFPACTSSPTGASWGATCRVSWRSGRHAYAGTVSMRAASAGAVRATVAVRRLGRTGRPARVVTAMAPPPALPSRATTVRPTRDAL